MSGPAGAALASAEAQVAGVTAIPRRVLPCVAAIGRFLERAVRAR